MKANIVTNNGDAKKVVLTLGPLEAKALFSLLTVVEGDEETSPRKFTDRIYKNLAVLFEDGEELDTFAIDGAAVFQDFKKFREMREAVQERKEQIDALMGEVSEIVGEAVERYGKSE